MNSGSVIPFSRSGQSRNHPIARGGCTCPTGPGRSNGAGACPLCKAWSDLLYHETRAAEAMRRVRALGGP